MTINLSRLTEDFQRVFRVYVGMDKEYVALIRRYHTVAVEPDFTMQAKNKAREETKEAVQELKRKYFEQAKEMIEKIREEYRPKVEPKSYTTEERLLNVALWTQTMPQATVDELRQLYLEYKGDPDFEQLLEAEIRRRDDSGDLNLQALKHERTAEPQDRAFAELKKLEAGLAFLTSQHYYPAKLESLEHNELRNVDSDLDRYPIDDGHIFRPLFDIK
ncbi:MAG: hypothetical protein WAQ32_08945 [Dethiobacteria bacterium]